MGAKIRMNRKIGLGGKPERAKKSEWAKFPRLWIILQLVAAWTVILITGDLQFSMHMIHSPKSVYQPSWIKKCDYSKFGQPVQ